MSAYTLISVKQGKLFLFKLRLKRLIYVIFTSLYDIKRNFQATANFILKPIPHISFFKKLSIIFRFINISRRVKCLHYLYELLTISQAFLEIPSSVSGVFVEAGSYKGGSTAKLSLIAQLAKRKLIVFDSFRGLPKHNDSYTSRDGLFFRNTRHFNQTKTLFLVREGEYAATLDEVKKNVGLYGAPEVCKYRKGWFETTLPKFHEPIAGMFLDVDLSSSTKTCLQYLYPLLQHGGILFSHDGHLDLITSIYSDHIFWKEKIGVKRPTIEGLKTSRLLKIQKA